MSARRTPHHNSISKDVPERLLCVSRGQLAGKCTIAVALLSLGAVLRGKDDPSVMYTVEQNPVPLVSAIRLLFRKGDSKSDDRRAADADAIEQEKQISTMDKWRAHDRFSKIVFMMVYVVINAVLWIHWALNAYHGVKHGSPYDTAAENSDPTKCEDNVDAAGNAAPVICIPATNMSPLWIPIAKGCGQLLNFNCALIVVPVITELLHWLHDVKVQADKGSAGGHASSETTLSKYVPLGKNITFHRENTCNRAPQLDSRGDL